MYFRSSGNSLLNGFKRYLVAACVLIVLAGCAAPQPRVETASSRPDHALIIDAGSSGSRIYIYEVGSNANSEIPEITLLGSSKVEPGISEYETNPGQTRKDLGKLIVAAKEKIDAPKQKNTPLYLLATAGMRLISDARRERILKEVSRFLIEDGTFDFKTAVVISGAYEGLYAWLGINYLDDRFDSSKTREGVLEMGGASTQVAFTPSAAFTKHKVQRVLRGKTYDIFTRSYLYMGVNEARELAGTANCYPPGLSADETGGFVRCASDISDKFDALCENLECAGPHCIFREEAVPLMDGNFFALSSFYYTFKILGLEQAAGLKALRVRGGEFCSTDWDQLQKRHPKTKDKYLREFCFNSAYFWSFLKHGYGISDNRVKIIPKNEIDGWGDINWTLGALIDITLGNEPMKYQPGEPVVK
ncbi:MAG: hypothetical protein GY807_04475 [Gammaproteobacteria bacterium]|nr:hypothetical protein [Gammaproteobacteria bacterium]